MEAYQTGGSEGTIDIKEADGVLDGTVLERREPGSSSLRDRVHCESLGYESRK